MILIKLGLFDIELPNAAEHIFSAHGGILLA
jgi:hypothetical protein